MKLVPNATTIAAMEEARAGSLETVTLEQIGSKRADTTSVAKVAFERPAPGTYRASNGVTLHKARLGLKLPLHFVPVAVLLLSCSSKPS